MTMGYYRREDLPFYWALADNFTLLDGYHSSILGPTHPNRLMANLEDGGAAPDVPTRQTMPNQQGGTTPASTHLTAATSPASPGDAAVTTTAALRRTGQRPMTVKSSYNRLAHVRPD
jgi:phospholipase C